MSYNYPARPPGLTPQPGYATCKHCNGWGYNGSPKFNFADEDPTCPKCWGYGVIRMETPIVQLPPIPLPVIPQKRGWDINE